VDPESTQDAADVVASGVDADVQVAGDLSGRTALLKEPQNLMLPGSQGGKRWEMLGFVYIHDLAEDADDVTAALEWDCAQLCVDPLPSGVKEHAAVVRSLTRPEQIAHEDLVASTSLLRRKHRGQVTAANVADNALRGLVDPADDSVPIDHVCRDTGTLQRPFQISAKS
jgi:hypothetical protein